jgi:hypothetical protein
MQGGNEGGGVVPIPGGLEKFSCAEGFNHALDGGEGEMTEPGEVVVAQAGDQVVGFVPESEVDALCGRGEVEGITRVMICANCRSSTASSSLC